MADRYENDLLGREDVTQIDIDTDYIRTLDENGVSYKDDMANVAEVFIENYRGSSLGGTGRTVKQAFDAYGASIASIIEDIVSINDRICTSDELTALEERLGL